METPGKDDNLELPGDPDAGLEHIEEHSWISYRE